MIIFTDKIIAGLGGLVIGLAIGIYITCMFFLVANNPKVKIKKLWKKIFRLTAEKKKWESKSKGDIAIYPIIEACDRKISKIKNLISDLLDFYFDPQSEPNGKLREEDAKFVGKNKP